MSKRKPSKRGSSGSGPKKKPAARKSSAARKPAAAKKKPAARKPAAKRKPAARKSTASRSTAARTTPAAVPLEETAALTSIGATTDLRSSLTSGTDEQWSFREMAKRLNLKHRPTQIAIGSAALVVVLIAAAIAWPGGNDSSSDLATDASRETIDAAVPGLEETADEKKAADAPTTVAEEAPANPLDDPSYERQVGSQIEPQSTTYGDNPNTWTGVTKDQIKFAIAYDATSCGVNTLTLAQQAGANLATSSRYYRATPKNQEETRAQFVEAAKTLIEVVNRRALEGAEDFPKIRALMGDDPTHPFFGRRISYELVDGGSYQCPDTQTKAAVDIVETIKPFVVVNDDALSRSAYNLAAALNAKAGPDVRPMHFGTLSESDSLYKKWSPFAWTQFASGSAQMRQYASWLCTRVAGKKAANSTQYKGANRKIALLYPNFQQVRLIANELKAFTNQYCGKNPFAEEIAYDTDPARAADQGTTIAVNLKSQGITSVAYLLDLFSPLFHIIAMKSQEYRPEFIFTPTNYMDSSTVQRLYEQDMVDKASFGLTNFGVPGGFGYEAGDTFYAYHESHQKSPKTGKKCDPSSDAGMNHDENYCKAPGAIVTLYYSILPLIGGIVFAGPDLNPTNVTNGLQEYPETRFGGSGPTTDPRPALVGAGKGRHYFIIDATEWRWRANFVSPPPESKLGWADYPDCQRHYYLWPDKLAKNWEKSGPEYGAWCGDARFAPKPNEPRDLNGDGDRADDGESCEDAPAGKCEADGYPRWGPENKAPK